MQVNISSNHKSDYDNGIYMYNIHLYIKMKLFSKAFSWIHSSIKLLTVTEISGITQQKII